MFVVELCLGLFVGAVTPGFLIVRRGLRTGAGMFGIGVLSIVILSLPLELSVRVAIVLGLMAGFVVTATIVRANGSQTAEPTEPAPRIEEPNPSQQAGNASIRQ